MLLEGVSERKPGDGRDCLVGSYDDSRFSNNRVVVDSLLGDVEVVDVERGLQNLFHVCKVLHYLEEASR